MPQITLDAKADQVSAKLTKRGIAADARVHVLVDVLDVADHAHAGHGFDWLGDEPDLYADEDLAGHSY